MISNHYILYVLLVTLAAVVVVHISDLDSSSIMRVRTPLTEFVLPSRELSAGNHTVVDAIPSPAPSPVPSPAPSPTPSQHTVDVIHYARKHLTKVGQEWTNPKVQRFHVNRSIPWLDTPHCTACGPDAIFIGTGHAGSTTLYSAIVQHPQVMPSIRKELNWFGGLNEHWDDAKRYHQQFHPKTNPETQISIEVCTVPRF